MDRIQILADIIEPSLSGQYGRDVAEYVAKECVRTLDMVDPIKWQSGIYCPKEDFINWGWGGFVYAENEQQAIELLSKILNPSAMFGAGYKLCARQYPKDSYETRQNISEP